MEGRREEENVNNSLSQAQRLIGGKTKSYQILWGTALLFIFLH